MNNNSVSGGQQPSSCGSHLDFINYWADKTVKEAVLRGQQLRQEKLQPLPPREIDVVNIDFIKPPRSMKNCGYHRKKSPKKHSKRLKSRSNSPCCRDTSPAQSLKMPKRRKCRKPKTKAPCAMRIAELAVPTKRQCLDTWRNKCNTLPAFMIERLRQHVLDQKPVVEISDAIYCFQRNKYKKQKNAERPIDKTPGRYNTKTKKPVRHNEVKTLSAIFGHKIAKKLYKPQNIKLNSNLEKLACAVSYDIAKLMCKSKKYDMNNMVNKSIHKDIAEKVTLWMSDILDETTYKILEDQLRDFEEEAGPALDCVDDLLDNVLDICVPQPQIFEEPSSSGFSSSDEAGLEEEVLEERTLSEKASTEDALLLESGIIDTLPEIDVFENIEDHFKNEIMTIINNIDKDADTKSDEYLDVDDAPDWQSSEDAEAVTTDVKDDDYLESEGDAVWQPSEDAKDIEGNIDEDYVESEGGVATEPNDDAEGKDTDENIAEGYVESEDGVATQPNEDTEQKDTDENIAEGYVESEDGVPTQPNEDTEPKDTDENIDEDYVESEDGVATQPNEDAEAKDTDENVDESYVEPEDGEATQPTENAETNDSDINGDDFDNSSIQQPIEMAETFFENADNIAETLTDDIDENKDEENLDAQIDDTANGLSEASSDENNRKVTFTEKGNKEENPEQGAEGNLDWKASVDRMDFAAPNQELLSDADESWPEEMQLPIIRPSQSVSKSITSLGKINEVDEKSSVLPEKDSHLESDGETNTNPNADLENQEQAKNDNEEAAAQLITDSLGLDTEERTKSPAEIDENFNPSVKEPTEPLETTSEHGEKVDDQLPKETTKDEVSSLHLENNAKAKPEKETRISESKRPGKKATSISKSKTQRPSKSKTNLDVARPPIKRIPKKEKTVEGKDRPSTSKAKSKDIQTAGTSQSVKDLSHDDVEKAKDIKRVKPKPDYRVHVKTAPSWIKRKYGEPSCSCVNIPSTSKVKREMNENEIRRWCRDLEQGYENLKMWNEWVDNTSRTISVLHQEIGGLGCAEKCRNKEWKKLKRNIDKDAVLWKKLNLTTQERLRCYKKMYQKQSEIPANYRIVCCTKPK